VVYDSTFGAAGIMDLMLADLQHYSPKIVICPDILRGEIQLKEQYKRIKAFFVNKYGAEYVVDGYDEKTGEFIDVSDQFDVIYCANPYDHMVNKVHGVQYLSTRNVLPVYISYCFQPNKYTFSVMSRLEISLFYKVFTDTIYTQKEYEKYELINGQNVSLTGYAKMDSLHNFKERKRDRKRCIISPHHTITNTALPLSNFLRYKDFILELPMKYPNVDFVFRPHPLLFANMINEGFWSIDDRDLYIKQLTERNIEYSSGGDYFDLFVNSDALINDCSSYIVEYLYVNKPCCFVANDKINDIFSELGRECLKCHNIATSEYDILKFIDSVIQGNVDMHSQERKEILPQIMVNYPNVSSIILKQISFN
jgi:hypothetical protein